LAIETAFIQVARLDCNGRQDFVLACLARLKACPSAAGFLGGWLLVLRVQGGVGLEMIAVFGERPGAEAPFFCRDGRRAKALRLIPKSKCKCGGLSTARWRERMSIVSVEMTILRFWLEGIGNGKCNSRSPSGMTTRTARTKATAKATALWSVEHLRSHPIELAQWDPDSQRTRWMGHPGFIFVRKRQGPGVPLRRSD
jgi:hypothetical protein